MARTVFIVESEDHGLPSDGHWLTGRFEGHLEGATRVLDRFEDLPLEEALAWARERADRVFIRHGDEPDTYYSAGRDRRPGVLRWPPRDLPELVRRRPPDERWLDRTDADPAIAWRVEVQLVPPDAHHGAIAALPEQREAWAAVVERVADVAGALSWDTAPLDEFIEDLRAAQRRAARGSELGWVSSGRAALRVVLAVEAPTAARAESAAAARLPLPGGWGAEPAARPLADPSS